MTLNLSLPEYEIYEDGKLLCVTSDWTKTVLGLNTAMDIVDGPYSQITVKDKSTGEVIYTQTFQVPL